MPPSVHNLLKAMVELGASDLHITSGSPPILRIDGKLTPLDEPPLSPQDTRTICYALLSDAQKQRFEAESELDLSFGVKGLSRFRANIYVQRGAVTGAFRQIPFKILSFQDLGLPQVVNEISAKPRGLVLVTGPTGSGKTNTLYAALADINKPDQNIITIEDPVEIRLPGISQIEVKSAIGLTFAAGLRSILRQNPNVILIGEIRDLETAEIAIQASLTGHLVFSTLHTNEAAGTITRLIDMGVEPFLIASSLVAAIGQRLIRVLCKRCREAYAPGDEELAELALTRADVVGRALYRAKGCVHCNHTGYHGRTGIFEILPIDEALRAMITRGIDSKQIQDVAMKQGMQTMRMHGARMVLEGTTSIAEIVRQTEEEAVAALDPQAA